MTNRTLIARVATYSVYVVCAVIVANEASAAAGTEAVRDRSPGELPVQAAFLPLAPGTIEPEGWLRHWAMAARDGITAPARYRLPLQQARP